MTEAVGEVGGYSMTIRDDLRLYLVQTAEKGIAWLNLRATGTGGHGSMLNDDNAVTKLARRRDPAGGAPVPRDADADHQGFPRRAVRRAGQTRRPQRHRGLPRGARPAGAGDRRDDEQHDQPDHAVRPATRSTSSPPKRRRRSTAGSCRGTRRSSWREIDELLGDDVVREFVHHDIALETSFDGPTIDAMAAALRAEDPGARPVPYMMSGGTDAKAWSRLGIRCFGFAPLRLPPDLDFGAMFHGVDERVPVDAVRFGVRVLHRFLAGA